MKNYLSVILAMTILSYPIAAFTEQLPSKLQIALMNKVISLERKLMVKSEISIFVLEAPQIAALFEEQKGIQTGSIKIVKVGFGQILPTNKYDVIYFANPNQQANAVRYASNHQAMTIYPIMDGMNMLGSLGLGIKSGKPTFLLNLSQSKSEGLDWNPAVLKVATTR